VIKCHPDKDRPNETNKGNCLPFGARMKPAWK
jgi:hypothetical protein